jgi:N6-L-threonylcarbamoyladenine synthase
MISLGIESTAHTFSIGIVKDKEVLSNVSQMYRPKKGGIVPREAMTHHVEIAQDILKRALTEAKLSIENVDIISFSAGPGLPPCLRVGSVLARALGLKYNKPVVPVNHCVAHVEIAKMTTGFNNPIILYVSGGNTQILGEAGNRYRTFGEAIDIPIGNCLDQFARELGIPHPGGPTIETLAKSGRWVELPYVVKGMDVSFSGILTQAIDKFKTGESKENICFSLQEVCFSMLTEVCERALAHTGKTQLLLTGGVAANSRLQKMLQIMCSERNAKFAVVPQELAGDCGAMIAYTGILARENPQEKRINRFWRTDDVEIKW